ncbi:hypothetical protein BYT27DRAFT_7226487 [Phlegmacium glaucopus]|nr:hypothetical protein BYT27DRAFT_7226487 [Phlegmacium glaucopus]
MLSVKQAILDAEGYAECPDCGSCIHCGTVGLPNLEKQHRGTKICPESKAKRDKNAKTKKNGIILNFFNRPKPTLLSKLSKNLPNTIPEASNDDKLAEFAQDPANFDDKTFNQDDLWEEEINPCLKRILGWGTDEKRSDAVMSDSFEFEDSLGPTKASENLCKGYVLTLSDGKSPHTSYPFALHDTLVLPWDYSLRNGMMALFSWTCITFVNAKNKTLEKILTRINEGVHENAGYAYYGFSGLSEVLHCRTQQLRISELRALNQAKTLLSKATVLSDQKWLLMAIVSGKANRVDHILSIALLASYVAAAEGHYHPKSFSEEEDMKALLLWKLGGNQVTQINHCASGAPSVSYLRTCSTVPPIIPSHKFPMVQEVQMNVDATLHSVLDVVLHTILMFDEIATEKRIRWDPKTNLFLRGVVHYAGEATVAALGMLCKDNCIYPGRPVLVSGDCKQETGEEHANLIQTVLDGVNNLQETTRLRVAKIDDHDGELWIILLATDCLEELFGILRTMVRNDTNLDLLQLVCRLAGTTEVSNILAKYPHWDQAPRRLKLPALSRESKEIPDSANHIKPSSWRGNVKVKDVSLQTSWNRGRHLVEDECTFVELILMEMKTTPGVDILAPFGVLLFDAPPAEDDIDKSLEDLALSTTPSSQLTNPNPGRNNSVEELEAWVEVEDTLHELAALETVPHSGTEISRKEFNCTILINGSEIVKLRALARYSKFRKHAGSTDRLKQVQDVQRYIMNKDSDMNIGNSEPVFPADETEVLVNDIKIDGNSVLFVPIEMLNEDTITISYQMLSVRPATLDDDPSQKNDWRTYTIQERSFTVPGRLIQVMNPTISMTHINIPSYLFQSSVLIMPSQEFPYCEASGRACFVCETHQEVEENGTSSCLHCSPTVILDILQGQRVLEHIGAHILHNPGMTQSTELCGLCLRPPPFCEFFLTKGKGANGSLKINQILSRGCLMKAKYSYSVAAESSPSSPCSNVPVTCPLCAKTAPAIWKYFMKRLKMKKIWAKHKNVVVKRTKKSKILPLVVSKNHCAHIPVRYYEESTHAEGDVDEREGQREASEPTIKFMDPTKTLPMSEEVQLQVDVGEAAVNNKLILNIKEVTEHEDNDSRAVHHVGVLNRCLCGEVVKPGVNLNGSKIECWQPGCETRWYHLLCVDLEQAPSKWICEACEASGQARAKHLQK